METISSLGTGHMKNVNFSPGVGSGWVAVGVKAPPKMAAIVHLVCRALQTTN